MEWCANSMQNEHLPVSVRGETLIESVTEKYINNNSDNQMSRSLIGKCAINTEFLSYLVVGTKVIE